MKKGFYENHFLYITISSKLQFKISQSVFNVYVETFAFALRRDNCPADIWYL